MAAFLEYRAFEGVAVLSASQSKGQRHGAFISRALFPFDVARQSEFYELRINARATLQRNPVCADIEWP